MPICTRCHASKDADDFAWKNKSKGRRHSHCKSCQRPVSGQHYQENRADYIGRAQDRYQSNRTENLPRLQTYLEGHGCELCPERDPAVLSFVPREGYTAKDAVSRLLGQSWETVELAITHCQLLCSNCRRRNQTRR